MSKRTVRKLNKTDEKDSDLASSESFDISEES